MSAPDKLVVPDLLWQMTLTLFQEYTQKELEAGCFWYGVRTKDVACAMVLGMPRQINRRTNFSVSADSLALLVSKVCDPTGLVAVAQLHIHPGIDVRHSPWDDQQVVSRNVYSLVLPNYGRVPISLDSIGVHRYETNRWKRLSRETARAVIRVTASFVDTR